MTLEWRAEAWSRMPAGPTLYVKMRMSPHRNQPPARPRAQTLHKPFRRLDPTKQPATPPLHRSAAEGCDGALSGACRGRPSSHPPRRVCFPGNATRLQCKQPESADRMPGPVTRHARRVFSGSRLRAATWMPPSPNPSPDRLQNRVSPSPERCSWTEDLGGDPLSSCCTRFPLQPAR
ncbi:hypothetical protein BS50DRAFT_76197 [Corynespora cassiicola Philippines]|uniref:Uncharacterized protein n=1 Tax=Corynespora cassiicola Philippines TaxID=1448308 RepID=A0A2T2NGX7_CORCC|nr:hypothetical protein BS50DRAFT_76197 [Corynespora cassiicola Philippines]